MDIAGLVSTEALFDLDLVHPKTDKPLGIKVKVRAAGSEEALAVVRKQSSAILARQQRGKLVEADMLEENELDQAVSFVASWDWGDVTYDGVKPDSETATIKAILKKEAWIYVQVVKAARDIANFTRI